MREIMITLFLCGDVMLGRGIDQVLEHSNDAMLHEPYVKSAQRYVELAEQASGPIGENVEPAYVWGDALGVLERVQPAARVINLETAVTTSDDYQRGKGIHYRMHPGNVDVLQAAGVDCAVLANNHAMDWGRKGLVESLEALKAGGVAPAGAGMDASAAAAPVAVDVYEDRRVLVFAYACPSSGVPRAWDAEDDLPGVNLLPDLSQDTLDTVAARIRAASQADDIVVFSVHWGGNWGYDVPPQQQRFARGLIDEAGVDVVFGHSSHHPKGIEVHNERLILYGAGDFINDYEGIGGHEQYRPQLVLMYLPELAPDSGALRGLTLVPMRIERFRLHHAAAEEARWLRDRMNELAAGLHFELDEGGSLVARLDE